MEASSMRNRAMKNRKRFLSKGHVRLEKPPGIEPQPASYSVQEVAIVTVSLLCLAYIFFYYESFHFHVTHLYAHLGYSDAQHITGQRYLQGAGIPRDEEAAMYWFRRAAEQGHPHASYNIAVGRLKNMTTEQEDWEIESLLSHAARHGVSEAWDVLEKVYQKENDS
ncbi:DAP3-binding cell death enhancer 1-like [Protopterus annectens]|uniref:DAP3-binding cell death enhancer 1-like n=1 Tax=Protopterus annectens TaxID=7888 RepID=UPI001CFB35BB|nr:DAP3-binding cell death enhancer 1-like [Protopterus annectens]